MSIIFRPAVRENAAVVVMIAGATGTGKTLSALKIATGLGGRICGIDTENGRMLHYADAFKFDHAELKPPFSPAAYMAAVAAADEAGYNVIVIDSFTHEHSGDGGMLDMHEAELQRMAGDDWKRREACKIAAWIKPKAEHKKMLSRFLQCRAHIIMCFRAAEKIKMEKGPDGKMVPTPIGWQPDAAKGLPYEATVSVLLTPDAPGIPKPIKIQDQHKNAFPLDRQISEATGVALAQWAKGSVAHPQPATASAREEGQPARQQQAPVHDSAGEYSTDPAPPPLGGRVTGSPAGTGELRARADAKMGIAVRTTAVKNIYFTDPDCAEYRRQDPDGAAALYDQHWKRVTNPQ